jgi:hypothetical protein
MIGKHTGLEVSDNVFFGIDLRNGFSTCPGNDGLAIVGKKGNR